ncbi:MAG: hypothetical protein JNL08_21265 [Planctomycetes bacterium]|nr:hypothetical protein [Planctomycetota bacterium]
MAGTADTVPPRRAPRRSWRRRLVFAAAALLLVTLLVELAGGAAWWFARGSAFTWTAAAAARDAARIGAGSDTAAAAAPEQRAANAGQVVHPFLGFVSDPTQAAAVGLPISRFGLVDTRSPLRRRDPQRYVVAVLGGSLALQLALFADDQLAAALRRSPRLADREVEVVHLALGGWKQPQQLFALQLVLLLGGEFDCVLNLDGFNEIALADENVPLGVPAWFPRGWARLLDAVPTAAQQLRLGQLAYARDQRARWVEFGDAGWWSPTAQFVWWWRDRRLQRRIADLTAAIEAAPAAPSFAVTGPGTDGRSADAARRDMVALWQRASLQLRDLCAQRGIAYFHFLQPNQYVPDSKPIGPAEAAVAVDPLHPWGRAVAAWYPELQRAGAELRAQGVAFADLTGVFRDHPEPLYVDTCCHVGREGYVILAEHLAAAVRQVLDFAGVEWAGLEVTPDRLDLRSPLQSEALAVVGVTADGRRHDVTSAGFGTRITAETDGAVVGADGRVRATRRGSTRLRVEHGARHAELILSASWPDLLVAADGRSLDGAPPPRLVAAGDALPALARELELQCTGLPAEGLRLLVASLAPLPAVPPAATTTAGLWTAPLAGGTATLQATVPIGEPNGQPVFVRVYVLSPSGDVLATSNTVVVTRG